MIQNSKKTLNPYHHLLRASVIFTVLLSIGFGSRGNIRFEHLGLEDGLSQIRVYSILQDSQGFMWFGTEDGLNKYDGYQFTVYRHKPDDDHSLSNNFVWSIFEDADGDLWIGTRAGLNKFNKRTEEFIHYHNQPGVPHSLSNNSVQSVFEDDEGVLWVGTFDGLNKFDRTNETFVRYQPQAGNLKSLSNSSVKTIWEDRDGILWIGTENGLNKFHRQQNTFTRFQHQPDDPSSLSNNLVQSFFEDRDGMLWVGTADGLNRFDKNKEFFTRYPNQLRDDEGPSSNSVQTIFQDSEGSVWVGTEGGGLNKLVSYPDVGSTSSDMGMVRFKKQLDQPKSLSNNHVWSIYEDTGGNMWIGTAGGLNKFDRMQEAFKHYQDQIDDPNSLSGNDVFSIYEDSHGTLWVGTYGGGLNRFDRYTNTFISYQNQVHNPLSLSNDFVRTIYEDSDGNMWIGTKGGLNKFDKKTMEFTVYQNQSENAQSLSHNFIVPIIEDSDGSLWVGTYGGGLNKFDRENEVFTRYQYEDNNPNSLCHNIVWCIYEDSRDDLWIGTEAGLSKFDRQSGNFQCYHHQQDNPKSLSNNIVFSITEDSQGNLWVGTMGGLNKFNRDEEVFTYFREQDGLANDVIYGVLEDDQGHLWMSTNNGISMFNPQSLNFTNYNEKDGLQGNEFNAGSYYRDREGRVYFGGLGGLTEFYPDSVRDNTFIPPVVITDYLLFNKSVPVNDSLGLKQNIMFTKEIVLDYSDYIFAFEFSALNYRQSEKNQFSYMLENFNKDWVETDHLHRRATYTNLSPGEYVFKVRASNDDGVWNAEGASIRVTVLPPFWLTWWFRAVLISLLLGVVFIAYKRRMYAIQQKNRMLSRHNRKLHKEMSERKQAQEEKEKLEERLRQSQKLETIGTLAGGIAHDFNNILTPIMGFTDMAMESLATSDPIYDDLKNVMDGAHRAKDLVKQILLFSRKGETERKPISLQPLVNESLKLLRPTIPATIEINQLIDDQCGKVSADSTQIHQVIVNLCTNAWHAMEIDGGELSIELQQEKLDQKVAQLFPHLTDNQYVRLSIIDTGVGMDKKTQDRIFEPFFSTKIDNKGTGLGLAVVHGIVKSHQGDIYVNSETGVGTAFHVYLPLVESDDLETLSQASDNPLGKESILLVDDDTAVANLLDKMLIKLGYRVDVFYSSIDALSAFRLNPDGYDLIFSDLTMPKLSGIELAAQIQDIQPGFPVLIMTGYGGDIDRKTQKINGVQGIISKPVVSSEVASAIREILDK